MLKLSLFASRQFTAINIATVVFYGALAAAGYLLVLRCELTLDYTATAAGAVLIPSSVIFLVLSPVSGELVRRIGPRRLMTAGILAVAVGFVWLALAGPAGTYAETILPGVLLWGLGLGLTVTPLTAAVLAAVSDADLGEASAISDVASRLGGAVMTPSSSAHRGPGWTQSDRGPRQRLPYGDDRPSRTLHGGRGDLGNLRAGRPHRCPCFRPARALSRLRPARSWCQHRPAQAPVTKT